MSEVYEQGMLDDFYEVNDIERTDLNLLLLLRVIIDILL
jgi:hypothetical protein